MKKTEKIIAAVCTVAFGVLLIVLKDNFIGILMTVAGLCLIALGIADFANRLIPPAIIKTVVGAFVIFCGWVVVEAVLYILAAALLIFGILLLYDKIKHKISCYSALGIVIEYALPALCIAVGILLLFHGGTASNFIFVLSGLLTVLIGAILMLDAISQE